MMFYSAHLPERLWQCRPHETLFTDSHIISIGVVEDFPNFKMAAITAKNLIDADYKALVHISNSKRGFLICRILLHLIFSFYDLMHYRITLAEKSFAGTAFA